VWVARKPPGFAFIDFDETRDAKDAIRELDGNMIIIFYHDVSIWLCPIGGRRFHEFILGNINRDCFVVAHSPSTLFQ
jgi:RNA recognition motif-containing protein